MGLLYSDFAKCLFFVGLLVGFPSHVKGFLALWVSSFPQLGDKPYRNMEHVFLLYVF